LSQYETNLEKFAQFVAATNYQTDAEKSGSSRFWNPLTNNAIDSTGSSWRFDADGRRLISLDYTQPVVHVSYSDALAYCQWLSKKTGNIYFLPSEAEWEYATGNGLKHNTYIWSDDKPINNLLVDNLLDETFQKNFATTNYTKFDYYTDCYAYTSPVGKFKPNRFCLYDMSGNVTEWCSDWYSFEYYVESTASNPKGESIGITVFCGAVFGMAALGLAVLLIAIVAIPVTVTLISVFG
jgi:sulfatase modifying factor 1